MSHDIVIADKPKDECGVFGIWGPGENVSRLTYFGLHALQHRGQESAGIAVTDGKQINVHKGMGLVMEVFNDTILNNLNGSAAVGHVRYSPTGSNSLINAQPWCLDAGGVVQLLPTTGTLLMLLRWKSNWRKWVFCFNPQVILKFLLI